MTTDTSAPTWNATPITGTFGIELTGDELRRGFDPDWLLSLLEEHLLVVIRDQFGQQPAYAYSYTVWRTMW